MESERRGEKLWIHSYGHGGSGITLCWGAAHWVVDQIQESRSTLEPVAVLGAGVMGLCTSLLLLRAGFEVTVYAKDFPPHTTSDIAGGLWAPTHVSVEDGPEAARLHRELLQRSWQAFQKQEGDLYGVYRVNLYETFDSPHPLDPMPAWLVGEGNVVERLPFGEEAPSGTVWSTYLIETGVFLQRLLEDIQEAGGLLKKRSFRALEEVEKLTEGIVVNCLGLGAGALLNDSAMIPVRGQLLYLEPLKERFIVDHAGGYVISRGDVLVLGGTFEEGVTDLRPCPKTAASMLEGNRDFPWGAFSG
jgi:glycine/D-amino acid oxidase-like deaminating enzyme